ncbi:hypothetical protein SEA_MEDIUMFRY_1 [Arthrobacter phage MediumFry]|nr:hypothetical protein SEA_MEDIUMFRY_1 [Arthrobacter phage MediumFry]
MAETPKAPETTPADAWLVPNQNLIEQVIDARLAAHSASEKSSPRTSSRNTSSSDDKKS